METIASNVPAKTVRTRFAPAPSGSGNIHLGNIRAALINLIFAKKYDGTFVLRIEDTDEEKSSEKTIKALLADLQWLNILYDEGPEKDGGFGPYFQSQRHSLYQTNLNILIDSKKVYRCFCSQTRLDQLKAAQVAAKTAPKYDRLCLKLSDEEINKKVLTNEPFVWRFLIDYSEKVSFVDMIRGQLVFDMQNFTDFVICRTNGAFNFLFANFVDDMQMKISHIIRGEDHLSNTALQCLLYKEFKIAQPVFMHLPLILDQNGQKLSKSSQNFNLHEYKKEGFLPEAICNYLLSLGSNLDEQAYSLKEIADTILIENLSAQSVRFDLQKIKLLNQKWIQKISSEELLHRIITLLQCSIAKSAQTMYIDAISLNKQHSFTLVDLFENSKSLVERPILNDDFLSKITPELSSEEFLNHIKEVALLKTELSVPKIETYILEKKLLKKDVFSFLRLACTGKKQGLTINEIFSFLPTEEIVKRINFILHFLKRKDSEEQE